MSKVLAIGGVGGSGTRVLASLMSSIGLNMGPDINDAVDNLWFTLLFKTRSVLLETDDELAWRYSVFSERMQGRWPERLAVEIASRKRLIQERQKHSAEWLRDRLRSLVEDPVKDAPRPWGWKEPNTHILIDRILRIDRDVQYIHVVRNAFEMATSSNQNQLQLWGPIFLETSSETGPKSSLTYWCEAHRRVESIAAAFPNRVMMVRLEDIIGDPQRTVDACLQFADLIIGEAQISAALTQIKPDRAKFRERIDYTSIEFEPADLAYAQRWGYAP